MGRQIDDVAPERLTTFGETVVAAVVEDTVQWMGEDEDWSEVVAFAEHYWRNTHPTLPLEKQRKAEWDAQCFGSLHFYAIHNAISVMAHGEALSSLVQRALFSELVVDRDRAMCKAVRVDNNLREQDPQKQALAQYPINGHTFEVKDKGAPLFPYILEDGAFRIQLSKGGRIPMAYVKVSSAFLAHVGPAKAERELAAILGHLGVADNVANVSRIDLFVDFVWTGSMEWDRSAWITRATSIDIPLIQVNVEIGDFQGVTALANVPLEGRPLRRFVQLRYQTRIRGGSPYDCTERKVVWESPKIIRKWKAR